MATAKPNHGNSAGSLPTDATLPASPAALLIRMNKAAIPDVRRGSSHPSRMIKGLRKIPPPVPVRPARNPNAAPTGTATIAEGGDGVRAAVAFGLQNKRIAAIQSSTPTIGR